MSQPLDSNILQMVEGEAWEVSAKKSDGFIVVKRLDEVQARIPFDVAECIVEVARELGLETEDPFGDES